MKKMLQNVFIITSELFVIIAIVAIASGMFAFYDVSVVCMILGVILTVINSIISKMIEKED